MKLSRVLAAAALLSTLASCSYLQKLSCNTDNAKKRGESDAALGLANKPGLASGKSCEGAEYTAAQFEQDYTFAFNVKKAEMCTPAHAAALGKEDGTNGEAAKKQLAKLEYCKGMNLYTQIEKSYNTQYNAAFCSDARASKLGSEEGSHLANGTFDSSFSSCSTKMLKHLKTAYTKSYEEGMNVTKKKQSEDFLNTKSTANFSVNQNAISSRCKISGDKAAAVVEVNNQANKEVLLKGDWKFEYYNNKFEKITEDNYREAVLVNGNNKKQFYKMTLPKDADYCRAEFVVPNAPQTYLK